MDLSDKYNGTKRYLLSRWPLYLAGMVVILLSILALLVGIFQGRPTLIPLAFILFLVVVLLAGFPLWFAHRLYDTNNIRDKLFEIGQLRPDDSFLYLDVGLKWLPVNMSRRLTTGHIIVIDIYNPNLTPDTNLARVRQQGQHPTPDPRLSWRDGDISLLPLPDNSVPAVVLAETISEFWQQGDREKLISEIDRILAPGGRLILAERVRTNVNRLTMGVEGFGLETADYWRDLITQTGLRVRNEASLEELMYFIRADKSLPYEGKQLIFDF
ncbi:MAG: methyltransferase domain-containing protein [Candidatus Promineifilaceae bacterium]